MKKKYAIAAGALNVLLSLYEKVQAEDELAGRTVTPTLVGTMWASVRPVYAYEAARWAAQRMEVSHIISVRAIPSIAISSTKHYFMFGSRTFNITGVTDVEEAGRKLTIYCAETEGGAK